MKSLILLIVRQVYAIMVIGSMFTAIYYLLPLQETRTGLMLVSFICFMFVFILYEMYIKPIRRGRKLIAMPDTALFNGNRYSLKRNVQEYRNMFNYIPFFGIWWYVQQPPFLTQIDATLCKIKMCAHAKDILCEVTVNNDEEDARKYFRRILSIQTGTQEALEFQRKIIFEITSCIIDKISEMVDDLFITLQKEELWLCALESQHVSDLLTGQVDTYAELEECCNNLDRCNAEIDTYLDILNVFEVCQKDTHAQTPDISAEKQYNLLNKYALALS